MSCQDCNDSSNISLSGSWFTGSPCISTECGGASLSANCVIYNGANLTCSGVETLDSVEVALQKIDTKLCEVLGDYSTYTMNCLPTWWGEAITTQAEFVDAITAYACDIDTRFTAFSGTTYVTDQTALDVRLDAIEVPGITCSSASVTSTDTLNQVLTKYCTKFAALTTAIDISSVVWDNCLVVVSPPTTIAGGFQLLADQICDVYDLIGGGGILPVFNNYGSCIGGTSSDSLVDTIGLIKTRLCLTPTFDIDAITEGCFIIGDDFQTLIQRMVDELQDLKENYVTFDGSDFIVTATDGGDPCAGITVALATPLNQDRFVASNASDTSPSTLVDKLTSTGSVTFDDSSNTDISIDIADGDKGDITVSGTGAAWTIDNDVVTYAKIQNITSSTFLGRTTAGSGNIEEITVGAGLSFTGGTLVALGKQLLSVTVFNGSGTWTKPSGCTTVVVEAVGGGGGGGGAEGGGAQASAGGGGGGGCYVKCYITSGLGSTETVTIGAGGSAGGAVAGYGGAGGDTSFGALVVAQGGDGGAGMNAGTSLITATGGAPGVLTTYSGTVIEESHMYGDNGIRLSGTVAIAGYAADHFNRGRGYPNNVSSVGNSGSGAVSLDGNDYAGSAGLSGKVVVYAYS